MYYHHERRLVFLAQPHTASHSIAKALGDIGFISGAHRVVTTDGIHSNPHHAHLYSGPMVTKTNRGEWKVFSVIRNHFDLLLSRAWKGGGYRADIDWQHAGALFEWAMKTSWWVRKDKLFAIYAPDSDVLVRYENLEDDLAGVLGERLDLPHMVENPLRKGRHYREFFTDETRGMVEERYGKEMLAMGYSF